MYISYEVNSVNCVAVSYLVYNSQQSQKHGQNCGRDLSAPVLIIKILSVEPKKFELILKKIVPFIMQFWDWEIFPLTKDYTRQNG